MPNRNGFTLIEVMVALAVFSLAVLALVRLEGATARGAGLVEETTVAGLVARNVALDALTGAEPPPAGLVTGSEANGGRNWNWTRRVSPAGDPRVVRIDVAVQDLRGQTRGSVTMIRPPTPPAALPQPPGATPTPNATSTPPGGRR
ncbi:hypothetical protein GCM10011380_25790 [Sphingomonas metalli]|uniref:Type II secretion system protein I n=1 Tax=Sphingomonas metalli TaxID=1779358 RepID=A0A916WWG2_9SPHN|nr:type II secretion system minor pseudopilin GspI [Sphingomonas metalli]GGB35230.1 hypothetical protein GCM10011380_25790 [Sphingomonas metalli]